MSVARLRLGGTAWMLDVCAARFAAACLRRLPSAFCSRQSTCETRCSFGELCAASISPLHFLNSWRLTVVLHVCFRPHPAIWRAVTGAGLLYFMFAAFLLFQVCLQSGAASPLQRDCSWV